MRKMKKKEKISGVEKERCPSALEHGRTSNKMKQF